MNTLDELEKYLEQECYSFNELSIGKHRACEGTVIQQRGFEYIFGYSEMGNLNVLKSFDNEKELVDYALSSLERNKWNKSHLVAWSWSIENITRAETELSKMGIYYERNDILNYSLKHRNAYRIFVFGKDILRLSEFMKEFMVG